MRMLCFRVNLLDVVLPTLVTDTAADVNDNETTEVQSNDELTSDPLAAATDAAISAITSVAAARRNKTSKLTSLSNGKSVSKTGLNVVLPVINDAKGNSVLSSKGNANRKKQSNPSEIMVFKEEPSTSDKQTSPSNMILALTGNNSDEAINRCGIP